MLHADAGCLMLSSFRPSSNNKSGRNGSKLPARPAQLSSFLGPELPLNFMTLIKSHPILWRQSQLLIRPRYLSRHCFFNSNGETWSPAYPALIPPLFLFLQCHLAQRRRAARGKLGASATSLCISSRHARQPSDIVCLFVQQQTTKR